MALSTASEVSTLHTLSKYVDISAELRGRMRSTAAHVDRSGEYPEENMRLIEQSGLNDLLFTESMGGASPDEYGADTPAMVQILKNLGAGESSTAQIWAFNRGQTLQLLGEKSPLPEAIRQQLIDEVRNDGVRFCSPQAERYKRRRYDFQLSVRKSGTGIVVNGDKYFATGSPGAKYGHSTGLMEGFDSVWEGGAHDFLFDLHAPGVTLVDDWDNMGQRATGSGQIHFEDVYIEEGWHWDTVDGAFSSPNNTVGIFAQFGLTPIILGIGFGCVDALVAHLTERPTFPGIFDDTSTRYQIGLHASRLAASEASLMSAAEKAVAFVRAGAPAEGRAEVSIACSQAKVAIVEAVLMLTGDMQKFLGGQSTANIYGHDRFWRNARTLSLQDVMDIRTQAVGAWTLANEPPLISWGS